MSVQTGQPNGSLQAPPPAPPSAIGRSRSDSRSVGAPVGAADGRSPSPFLRNLRAAIAEDFLPERELACRVAVLLSAGFKRSEIQRKLDVSPSELKRAEERVRRAAPRLDHGDDEWRQ